MLMDGKYEYHTCDHACQSNFVDSMLSQPKSPLASCSQNCKSVLKSSLGLEKRSHNS